MEKNNTYAHDKIETVTVIPAFNECDRIEEIVLEARNYVDHIVVVDDGSSDDTASTAKKAEADVISYKKNKGVGYATRLGIKKAIDLDSNIIVLMDADGQHDPRYIPQFIKAIKSGADYVYGKRDLSRYPFSRKVGNLGLTLMTNIFCRTRIQDTESGYRAFTKKAAEEMELKADGYEIGIDFAYNIKKKNLKIKKVDIDVPIFYPKPAVMRGLNNFMYCCSENMLHNRTLKLPSKKVSSNLNSGL